MRDKKRKKLQKQVNKVIKNMNLAIRNDPLWKGRYFVRQIDAAFWNFEDKSGIEMKFMLRAYDRKTNKTEDKVFSTFSGGTYWLNWDFFNFINDFILNSGAWNENPRPTYENTPDYRKEHF